MFVWLSGSAFLSWGTGPVRPDGAFLAGAGSVDHSCSALAAAQSCNRFAIAPVMPRLSIMAVADCRAGKGFATAVNERTNRPGGTSCGASVARRFHPDCGRPPAARTGAAGNTRLVGLPLTIVIEAGFSTAGTNALIRESETKSSGALWPLKRTASRDRKRRPEVPISRRPQAARRYGALN